MAISKVIRSAGKLVGMQFLVLIFISFSVIILTSPEVKAQTENVGIGTNSPNNSAILELSISGLTSPRGFLAPRMTTAQRGTIPIPLPVGLLIYNTDNNRFEYYDGSSWITLIVAGFSFSNIGSGTNTTAAMIVGNGASLSASGTGYISANRFNGTGSTTDAVDLGTAEVSGTLGVTNGGTGLNTAAANGQILIGNGTGYTLNTITAGTNISVTNAAGSITIGSTGEAPLTFNNGLTRNVNTVGLGGNLNQNTTVNIGTFDLNLSAPGNTGNVVIGKFNTAGFVKNTATGVLQTGALATSDLPSLTDGNVWVGNGSNVPTAVAMTGDVTISNAGVTNITDNSVDGTDIAFPGNVNGDLMYYNGTDWTLLPAGTNGQVLKVAANIPAWGLDDNTTYTAGNGLQLTGTQFAADFAGTGIANTVSRSDHGHVQLHDRQHSMTSASDHTATAWRLFYSDGTGNVTELALGANGSYLQSNGAGAAPSWTSNTLPGGTDGQTLRYNGTGWEASSKIFNAVTGNNVGIGTMTSPNAILHQDAGNATANYHKFTAGTTTGQASGDGFDVGIDGSGNAELRQKENTNFIIYTNDTERMRVENDGQVLIGLTSTTFSEIFQVTGNVRFDGDLQVTGQIDPISVTYEPQATAPSVATGKVYYDNPSNRLKVYNGTAWEDVAGSSLPSGSDGQTLRYNGTSWEASSKIFNSVSGNNVGIGSMTNPTATLHQDAGNATASYHKFTAGTTTSQTATDGFDVGIDANQNAVLRQRENTNFLIYTNDLERMRVEGDGQILIGLTTTTFSEILQVTGNVRIDGDLQVTGEIDPISLTLQPQTTAPSQVAGKMYYDDTDDRIKYWNGTKWDKFAVGSSLPTGSTGQILRHDGTDWVASSNVYNDGTNVGIGTSSPNVKLDVNGALALRSTSISLSADVNNLDIGSYTYIRLSNSSASSVSITGFAGGYDGRILIITRVPGSGPGVTVSYESASSNAENRVLTGDGNARNIIATDGGSIMMIYDGTAQRWIMLSHNQ